MGNAPTWGSFGDCCISCLPPTYKIWGAVHYFRACRLQPPHILIPTYTMFVDPADRKGLGWSNRPPSVINICRVSMVSTPPSKMAEVIGLEPITAWLTAKYSTIELHFIKNSLRWDSNSRRFLVGLQNRSNWPLWDSGVKNCTEFIFISLALFCVCPSVGCDPTTWWRRGRTALPVLNIGIHIFIHMLK